MPPGTNESGGRAVRQAAGWDARRPAREDIRELASLVLDMTEAREECLPWLVRELAPQCRYAGASFAVAVLIREHSRRAAAGARTIPPLGQKAHAFHRSFRGRAAWEWLWCR
jgi:hypothetical protein